MSPSSLQSGRAPWPVLVGIALALGLAGLLWFLNLDSPQDGTGRGVPVAPPRIPGSPATSSGSPADPDPRVDLIPAEAPPALAPDERELLGTGRSGTTTFAPPPEDGLAIRVVTKASTPVPGASVAFLDERSIVDQDMLEVRAGTLTIDQILERVGEHYRADDAGIVRVPVPRGFGFVAGGTGQLWGMLEFPEHELEPVLVIAPDPPLTVRVIDAQKRPVGGVPVAFRHRYDRLVQDVFATVSEERNGLAILRHVKRFEEQKQRDGESLVALAVLAREPSEATIDPNRFPSAPIELTLPPTGRLELTINDGDGARFRAPVLVQVLYRPGSGKHEQRVQRVADGGRLALPYVGLGLELSIHLEAEGHVPVQVTHVGPSKAGEIVQVTAEIVDAVPVYVLTVLGPDGEPLDRARIEARVVVELQEQKTRITQGRARTSSSGRMRHALPEDWKRHTGPLYLELEGEDRMGSVLAARVALPAPAPGPIELGPVTLAPPPLIVGGEVLDPTGNPVAGAQVVLEVQRDPQDAENPSWQAVWEQRVRTDRKGRFVIRGELEDSLLGLSASHPDHAKSGRIEVNHGSADVEIILTPAGRIAGSLLFEEGFPHDLFVVHAQREPQPGPNYFAQVQADGTFVFTGVQSGTYRVSISLRDEAACGEEIQGIEVLPANTTADERLQGIDLTGELRSFSLEVVDESGAPLPQGVVSRRVPGAHEFEAGRIWMRQGRADIATCLPAVDLEIDVPGYRPVLLEAVSEDQKVTLRPGPRLEFSLRNAPQLAEGITLGVQVRQARAGRWKPTDTVWFEGRSVVELQAKGPGPHEVYVMYMKRVDNARRSQQLSTGPEARIEVEDMGGVQTFEIELTEATLARLERL